MGPREPAGRQRCRSGQGRLVLILGGARSGKSGYAQNWAESTGRPVTYLATATAGDADMARRIARHHQDRPAKWTTVEEPRHVGQVLLELAGSPGVVIVDCLTLLASNALLSAPPGDEAGAVAALEAETADLVTAALAGRSAGSLVLVVSNEVGLGVVATSRLGRLYRDALGRANQALAAAFDDVHFMVAGLPLIVKGEAGPNPPPAKGERNQSES